MNQIDLSQFAEHSQKIPAEFLVTPFHQEQTLKKSDVFMTHMMDSVFIYIAYSFFTKILDTSMKQLLPKVFSDMGARHVLFGYGVMALVGLTYFTVFNFFNQGQTPGMKMMKKRISMREHSFNEAIQWAMYSMSVYFSFGLLMKPLHDKLKAQGFGEFTKEDHHYREMMMYKTWKADSLVPETEQSQEFVEEFKEAA